AFGRAGDIDTRVDGARDDATHGRDGNPQRKAEAQRCQARGERPPPRLRLLGPDAGSGAEGHVNEKRAYSRYSLWFPVTLEADSRQVWAVCRDASAGGILISGSDGLSVGDVVTVSFRTSPDDRDERRISGRIVRVEGPDQNPRSVWPHRMAIEFAQPVAE